MLIEMVKNSSPLALLGLVVSLAVVGMALAYAIKPSEQRLTLIRPLSLAAIFGGFSSFTVGLIAVLQGISATETFTVHTWDLIARGVAETLTSLFVAFGCLTIAWLLVALGLRRS
jgi:multisubunit Na+/H+ antiporter MnhB subunit